jgi:NAD(P) transhydrogenase subunit alpha
VPGEDVDSDGVLVHGMVNAPSDLPVHASALYARNIANLLLLMVRDGEFAPDYDDEVVAGCCLTRDGELVHPSVKEAVAAMGGQP